MKRMLLAVTLVLGILATASVGHAAVLSVDGGWLTALSLTGRCSAATVALTHGTITTGDATDVVLTIPAGCHGAPGMLHLEGVSGAADVAFVLPASGATASIPIPGGYAAVSVTGVALTLGTWGMATSWTYTAPPAGAWPTITCTTTDNFARPCTATAVPRSNPGWLDGYDIDITITDARTGHANNPVAWTVVLDFTNAPFLPKAFNASGLVVGSTCADLAAAKTLTATGVTTWSEHDVLRLGESRTVWLQGLRTGSGSLLTCP